MRPEVIEIRGARQHNLRIDRLLLPKHRLIVFTGVSGSGKSSLAFDTLYAEGQRRYIESLSSFARQFLGWWPIGSIRRRPTPRAWPTRLRRPFGREAVRWRCSCSLLGRRTSLEPSPRLPDLRDRRAGVMASELLVQQPPGHVLRMQRPRTSHRDGPEAGCPRHVPVDQTGSHRSHPHSGAARAGRGRCSRRSKSRLGSTSTRPGETCRYPPALRFVVGCSGHAR